MSLCCVVGDRYLLLVVCTFAFTPPIICKLRQMYCTDAKIYSIEDEDLES